MPKVHQKGRKDVGNKFLDNIINRVDGSNIFVLANAKSEGIPVVYCSEGFYELTGFRRSQVRGKPSTCSFLYGALTKDEAKQRIKDALQFQQESRVQLCLYTKLGDPFWCGVEIMPILNENQEVVLFLITYHKFVRKESSVDVETQENQDCNADRVSQTGSTFSKGKSRGRTLLCNLTRQFKSRRKKMGQLDKFQEAVSGQQAVPEYKVEVQRKGKGIILHYGFVKVLWDWLIMLCTFYIAIMVPFNAAFIVGEFDRTSIYADVAVEIIFGIDIVLNFRTTYVSDTGQVVYDAKLIALNYIRQWFLMDLLAAIPFDLLYAFQVETGTLIPLLKVARLLRLIRLFQKMDRYSQYASVVIILLLSMFTLTAHWLACIWYSIGKFEIQSNPKSWNVGWLHDLSEVLNGPNVNKTTIPDMWSCYLTALYFTCSSLTTVGFGNVSASTDVEKIFSICVMLVGAMMYALVFGNVTAIVQRAYARRATFHIKTNDLKDFYHTHNIPKPLKHRIQEYFQSTWTMNNGINFNELFYEFPEEIRGEISMHLYKEILSLPLFEGINHGCLKAISQQIRRSFCVPGEYLIHRGDAVSYLYFILSGSLEILKDDKVIALLGKGDLFGIDIQFDDPVSTSSFSVKSLTYCELQCINTMDLINVLGLYPNVAEQLAHSIQRELTFNLKDTDDEDMSFDEPATGDSLHVGDYKSNYLLPRAGSNVQLDKKEVSQHNSVQQSNFHAIVKKATRQKAIQNTLKRKIHLLKKEKAREENQLLHQKPDVLASMQSDIGSLLKEMAAVRMELKSTIELLCTLTHVPKESILRPLANKDHIASLTTAANIESYHPPLDLVKDGANLDTVTSDILTVQSPSFRKCDMLAPVSPKFSVHDSTPPSPKLMISAKDLEDITSETGVSEVTPEENITDMFTSDDHSLDNIDPMTDLICEMEEAKSSDFKESPGVNKGPHINVIFEPDVIKMKSPSNSTKENRSQCDDSDDDHDGQEQCESGPSSESKRESNSPFPVGLTVFPSTKEETGKTQIVTETTHV